MRACLFLLAACASFAVAQPLFTLPDDVAPTKYAIDLTIDPSQPTFTGIATIDIELKHAARTIWLNGNGLTDLRVEGGRAEAVGGEFIRVDLDSPAGPGASKLVIHYQGKLDDKRVVGPYRRRVGDDWYVFTTFTPIDARRAFPCFDEPRFKATWQLRINTKLSD